MEDFSPMTVEPSGFLLHRPGFPPAEEVDRAMEVFVTCVKLATVCDALRTRQG